jgi:hypothetical protein
MHDHLVIAQHRQGMKRCPQLGHRRGRDVDFMRSSRNYADAKAPYIN